MSPQSVSIGSTGTIQARFGTIPDDLRDHIEAAGTANLARRGARRATGEERDPMPREEAERSGRAAIFTAMARLVLERLEVGVAGRRLFRPLDLTLHAGERLALVGPSGSGKSTLLRTLARLEPTLGGHMTWAGEAAEAVPAPRWRRRAVYVPQVAVLRGETARAALAFPFGLAVSERAFPEAEALEGLGRLGLPEAVFARDPAALSMGERQRLALLRALLLVPPVLLLDEPTSALDPAAATRVEVWLREVSAAGTALLFVTHDPAQADRLGTRALDLGRLRAEAA